MNITLENGKWVSKTKPMQLPSEPTNGQRIEAMKEAIRIHNEYRECMKRNFDNDTEMLELMEAEDNDCRRELAKLGAL